LDKIILYLPTLLFLSGCVTTSNLTNSNTVNISKINTGMTKQSVEKILGIETTINGGDTKIKNPYRRETVDCAIVAGMCEVDYYYIGQLGEKDWNSGVMPIIFKNNKVLGVGWTYLSRQ